MWYFIVEIENASVDLVFGNKGLFGSPAFVPDSVCSDSPRKTIIWLKLILYGKLYVGSDSVW